MTDRATNQLTEQPTIDQPTNGPTDWPTNGLTNTKGESLLRGVMLEKQDFLEFFVTFMLYKKSSIWKINSLYSLIINNKLFLHITSIFLKGSFYRFFNAAFYVLALYLVSKFISLCINIKKHLEIRVWSLYD